VDGGLAALLARGAADALAIDRDDAAGHASDAGDPCGEAALELFGVEDGKYVAQVIVRRGTVLERAEAAQQVDFLDAEQRDLGEAFGPSQHCQQAKQQNLVQRVTHLSGLARIV